MHLPHFGLQASIKYIKYSIAVLLVWIGNPLLQWFDPNCRPGCTEPEGSLCRAGTLFLLWCHQVLSIVTSQYLQSSKFPFFNVNFLKEVPCTSYRPNTDELKCNDNICTKLSNSHPNSLFTDITEDSSTFNSSNFLFFFLFARFLWSQAGALA